MAFLRGGGGCPHSKVEGAFRILYAVYRGALRPGGSIDFSIRGGDWKLRRQGEGPNRECPQELCLHGRAERGRLEGELNVHFSDDEPEDSGPEDL